MLISQVILSLWARTILVNICPNLWCDDYCCLLLGGFSDSDLIDVSKDDTYKPDKGKETTAEVGTIAGIVSAVAMALVGAISSYISYQKKKFCFSIQRKVTCTFVSAVQQTLLEPPNAEPPTEENAV
uniref:CD99 antigen-like protein 2 n=1 Tax=Amphiprion percula TaxID=161767 RepID=A0A3P8SV31_AMPPE